MIDQGPVIDHFQVFISLFSRNSCSKPFSCLDSLHIVLEQYSIIITSHMETKSSYNSISILQFPGAICERGLS